MDTNTHREVLPVLLLVLPTMMMMLSVVVVSLGMELALLGRDDERHPNSSAHDGCADQEEVDDRR